MTFLAGGIAVVGAAVAVGRSVSVAPPATDAAPLERVRPLVPFACGLASAASVLTATSLVPAALPVRAQLSTTIVAAAAALAAITVRRAAWTSDARAMVVAGMVLTVICRLIAPWAAGVFGLAVAFAAGVGVGAHLATALPFALSVRPAARAGLVSGLYVAGAALGSVVVRAVL